MEKCLRCGRPLKDDRSIKRGMGPVCWKKAHGDVFEADLDASDEEWKRREETLRMGGEIDLGVNWQYPVKTEDGWTVPVQMRVSVRFRDGAFEAYGHLYEAISRQENEIVFCRSTDLRTVYREAVHAGPYWMAVTERERKQKRAAARRKTKTDVMKMLSSILA